MKRNNKKTQEYFSKKPYTKGLIPCYNGAQDLLSPQNDYVFKRIFGDVRNADILADFLQAALDLPAEEFESLTFDDPHLNRDEDSSKLSILDVRVHTKGGRIIHVEIQVLPVPAMRERIVFYTSRLITGQLGSGDDYAEIQPVVSIIITGHNLFTEDQNFQSRFVLYEPDKKILFSDRLAIRVFELPKVPEGSDSSGLWEWMMFLKSSKKEELAMLAEKNPSIRKAVGVLMEMSEDESERRFAEAREKARRDEASRVNGAYGQGHTEGKAEGHAEGKAEGHAEGKAESIENIVRNALRMNMAIEDIIALTGLSCDEIERLRESN